ncbi:DNA methyltransferase [Neomegalonema sp.]|uniref:class I SAM-dependent DNA methyltransferase n=1 Tax=Neomegalonema sp. TaxID=2039713 RepID=UPI0026126220|nr:DNA methyltransferase [Neomegalonema sp.]MDD2868636.1 class I SAM-dependent DNA methyltransferase [Neomegalonema sp.]
MSVDDENARAAKFIERWAASSASERANYQSFLIELAELLGAPRHDPANGLKDDYVFERRVTFHHAGGATSPGFIDLYKRGCFVLEAKQSAKPEKPADLPQLPLLAPKSGPKSGKVARTSSSFDAAMWKARAQAEKYAKALPKDHGWPPFIIAVDIGHIIDVYADFSLIGKNYAPFPDPQSYRIKLEDLLKPEIRARLLAIWTDPLSLDRSREAARVTREIATHLSLLAVSLEKDGHPSEVVARFLMRCLFTMFAEDVKLLPKDSFKELLRAARGAPESFPPLVTELWQKMDGGGFSTSLRKQVSRFNGFLFKETQALPLRPEQLGLLIGAAEADWSQVEPAIFGTLLERALAAKERHKLGAHYTPRPYVERLVRPVLIDPLREDWMTAKGAALALAEKDEIEEARKVVQDFHKRLCALKVLDPACGSGNFLYVALEEMKRLEGEVNELRAQLRDADFGLSGETVSPEQFLGLEVNPWAAAVAELVLWIGSLQQHFRLFKDAKPSEPILRDFRNIENRDAVLAWTGKPAPRLDDKGQPVTRWDGVSMILNPSTGAVIPDPAARVPVLDYKAPRAASWPKADVVIGNPPFLGKGEPMRSALGDGYVEALRKAWPDMPESADFVMFWWNKAAQLAQAGLIRRFGFVATNSLRQTFNRRVLEVFLNDKKKPLSLIYAIPDHPWVDATDGAAVRISMTAAERGSKDGLLLTVMSEGEAEVEDSGIAVTLSEQRGKIFANLQIGADVSGAQDLQANKGLSSNGVMLAGEGFIVSRQHAQKLGLGRVEGLKSHIRPYMNGRDFMSISRDAFVIDLFGLSESEAVSQFPDVYQHVLDKIKPSRMESARKSHRDRWWVFAEPRSVIRPALKTIPRYIATPETSKHRVFQFLPQSTLPDHMLIAIALDSAEHLAILSSRIHVLWALATGGTLEDRPRYNKSQCFDPFPFPALAEADRARLAELGEQLDAHRKSRQKLHPKLTLTEMYNVLAALRARELIEGKAKTIYDQGLIGILRQLHDDIDAATAAAYGWPADLTEPEILKRLVALNHARADEEARGQVLWLRPEYQNPSGGDAARKTGEMDLVRPQTGGAAKKTPWPAEMLEQMKAVRAVLQAAPEPLKAETVAAHFQRVKAEKVQETLKALVGFAQAHALDDGRFAVAS